MLVSMRVHILTFLLAVYLNRHMRTGNSALLNSFGRKRHRRNTQRIQLGCERLPVRQELQQCCCQHIACRTHTTIQI